MKHEPIDHEISELFKKSSESARAKNFDKAINECITALEKSKSSKLLLSTASVVKVIPYFQKAGRYVEAEAFCLERLIPLVQDSFFRIMHHRYAETQKMHIYQCVEKVYDKLRLIATRENKEEDRKRFLKEMRNYEKKWVSLYDLSNKLEGNIVYK